MADNEPKHDTPAEAPKQRPVAARYYKVKKGETLYSIARKLHMSEDKLAGRNSLKSRSKLRVGQILRY